MNPSQEGELADPRGCGTARGAHHAGSATAWPAHPDDVLLRRAAGDRKRTRNLCQAPSQGQRLPGRLRCSQEKLLLRGAVPGPGQSGHTLGVGRAPGLQQQGVRREESQRRLVQREAVGGTAAGRGGADQRTALQVTGRGDNDGGGHTGPGGASLWLQRRGAKARSVHSPVGAGTAG